MSTTHKIYCAGPLFNPDEQREMASIAGALEEHGYRTFLPHRDGLEFSAAVPVLVERGHSEDKANEVLLKAIFALDTYQVLIACDALVANLNGEVHDDGTVSELATAWGSGKPVFVYKEGVRDPAEIPDNPLVAGLSDFSYAASIGEIPSRLDGLFAAATRDAPAPIRVPADYREPVRGWLEEGERLSEALAGQSGVDYLARTTAAIEEPYLG